MSAQDSSVRLHAALAVDSVPDPDLLETLDERCAVEPDFFVRDMLTWALTRLSPENTLRLEATDVTAAASLRHGAIGRRLS